MRSRGQLWKSVGHLVEQAFLGESIFVENMPINTRRRGTGELAHFSFSYTPLVEGGKVTGVFAVVTETSTVMTEQAATTAERDRLRDLFEEAPGFLAMTEGSSHTYVFANRSFRDIIGHKEIIGKTVFDVNPEFVGTSIKKRLDAVYTSGHAFEADETAVKFRRDQLAEFDERFVNIIQIHTAICGAWIRDA